MPRKICPKCGNKFEPDEDWRFICSRFDWGCADEVDLYDEESKNMWRGLSMMLNAEPLDDHLEDIADSAGLDMLINRLWEHKDLDTKINLLGKWVREIQ